MTENDDSRSIKHKSLGKLWKSTLINNLMPSFSKKDMDCYTFLENTLEECLKNSTTGPTITKKFELGSFGDFVIISLPTINKSVAEVFEYKNGVKVEITCRSTTANIVDEVTIVYRLNTNLY